MRGKTMSGSIATRVVSHAVRASKRWTTEEFDRLVAEGFIREGSRTYLWNGEIIEPMAENRAHRNAVSRLDRILQARFPEDAWTVDQNTPVELEEGFKPRLDLVVLKGPRERYASHAPTPPDVALLVEVSDSTYADDSGQYLQEYAASRIPQYWIVNIPARRIEVFEKPASAPGQIPTYEQVTHFGIIETAPVMVPGDNPQVFDGVDVADVLRFSLEPSDDGGAQQ
jgi:hypothetical protein